MNELVESAPVSESDEDVVDTDEHSAESEQTSTKEAPRSGRGTWSPRRLIV